MIHKVWRLFLSLLLFFTLADAVSQIPDLSIAESRIGVMGGITIDKDIFLLLDSQTNEIIRFEMSTKRVIARLKLEIANPASPAFDGKNIWAVDKTDNKVVQLEAATGKLLNRLAPDLNPATARLEAVTFDGANLWISYFAGWSSGIAKIDSETGIVLMSFYAECYPKAITSSEKYIYVVCYNNGKQPCSVARFTIDKDAGKMSSSLEFLAKTRVREPSGIVSDGKNIYIGNKTAKTLELVPIK